MSFFRFFISNLRFLLFGLAMALFSTFGQTVFVGVFGGVWREEFDLSHGDYGALYSIATICSALTVLWVGTLVDRLPLTVFVAGVLVALGVSALAMPLFIWGPVTLAIGFYLIRLFGQGLSYHGAATALARYMGDARGRAMSVTALGFPIGQAVFPLIGVAMIAAIGWRDSWSIYGGFILLVALPLVLFLLRGQKARHDNWLAERGVSAVPGGGPGQETEAGALDWTRAQVIRDPRFWVLEFGNIAPAFIATALFFHVVHVAEAKGWTLDYMAMLMMVFAATQFATSLFYGQLVDQFGARKIVWWLQIPLTFSLFSLALLDGQWAAVPYLVLMAMTTGSGGVVPGALWAEIYGTAHLGAIRSLTSFIVIAATGASPFLYGLLMDRGVSIQTIALVSSIWCILAVIGARIITPKLEARPAP